MVAAYTYIYFFSPQLQPNGFAIQNPLENEKTDRASLSVSAVSTKSHTSHEVVAIMVNQCKLTLEMIRVGCHKYLVVFFV